MSEPSQKPDGDNQPFEDVHSSAKAPKPVTEPASGDYAPQPISSSEIQAQPQASDNVPAPITAGSAINESLVKAEPQSEHKLLTTYDTSASAVMESATDRTTSQSKSVSINESQELMTETKPSLPAKPPLSLEAKTEALAKWGSFAKDTSPDIKASLAISKDTFC